MLLKAQQVKIGPFFPLWTKEFSIYCLVWMHNFKHIYQFCNIYINFSLIYETLLWTQSIHIFILQTIKVLKSKLELIKGDCDEEFEIQKQIFQELSGKCSLLDYEKDLVIFSYIILFQFILRHIYFQIFIFYISIYKHLYKISKQINDLTK